MINRIEYVHSKSLLHRDIKPDNFLMGLGRRANQVIWVMLFLLSTLQILWPLSLNDVLKPSVQSYNPRSSFISTLWDAEKRTELNVIHILRSEKLAVPFRGHIVAPKGCFSLCKGAAIKHVIYSNNPSWIHNLRLNLHGVHCPRSSTVEIQ